jgi:hypothetical protein
VIDQHGSAAACFIWLAVTGVIGGRSGAVAGPYQAFGTVMHPQMLKMPRTSRLVGLHDGGSAKKVLGARDGGKTLKRVTGSACICCKALLRYFPCSGDLSSCFLWR